jgi:hypothetical protein
MSLDGTYFNFPFCDDAGGFDGSSCWQVGRLQPGPSGVKWLKIYDYAGFDIGYQFILEEQCGKACVNTRGCNAFSWHDGWCFLKRKKESLTRSPLFREGRCGLLSWEFADKQDIYIDNSATVLSKQTHIFSQQTRSQQSFASQQISPSKSQRIPPKNSNWVPPQTALAPLTSGGKNREGAGVGGGYVRGSNYDVDGDNDHVDDDDEYVGSSGYDEYVGSLGYDE